MKKKEKRILILAGIGILIFVIILGLIFFAISISKQKQARIEGYEKCKEDLESEWQQARLIMDQAQDKEIEFNDTLNSLGSCNNNLTSCKTDLAECKKIANNPNIYYLFGNTFEYNHEEITLIIFSILFIIPISLTLTLFKVVFRIKGEGLAFFLGAVFILLLVLLVMVIGTGLE